MTNFAPGTHVGQKLGLVEPLLKVQVLISDGGLES